MRYLHICDPNIALREAAASTMLAAAPELRLGVSSSDWLAFHDWGYGSDLVVLRADFCDMWPALLKVRALRRLDCVVALILPGDATSAARKRMLDAGAAALISESDGLEAALTTLRNVAADPPPLPRICEVEPILSDRVLQVACLYASTQSPSAQDLARMFATSVTTVRTQLQTARRILQESGWEASTRAELSAALRGCGLMIGESGLVG